MVIWVVRLRLHLSERTWYPVDLVNIDLSFASGTDYAQKVYLRQNPKVAEVITQVEQKLDIDKLRTFKKNFCLGLDIRVTQVVEAYAGQSCLLQKEL